MIEYGAVEFVAPEQVLYRTQLIGLDGDWSTPHPHRVTRYTNLRPGEYRFRVAARNWGGLWSQPAEFSIRVRRNRRAQELEAAIERARIEAAVQRATAQRLDEMNRKLVAAQWMQATLLSQLRRQTDSLARQASHDGLTGLLNRQTLDTLLEEATAMSGQTRSRFAVALTDIDQFKAINDGYSHLVGDSVLRTIALLWQESVRGDDAVGRYGGDEFLLLFQNATAEEAQLICERCRGVVEDYDWGIIAPGLQVRISIGISTYRAGLGTTALVSEADAALYDAKQRGRNQVCVFAAPDQASR